jgi:hypothetical protein
MKLFFFTALFALINFFAPAAHLQAADNAAIQTHINVEQRAPIEPIKTKKWFLKTTKKQNKKQHPNHILEADGTNILIYVLFGLGLLAMVGLPLGVGLLLPWLWITSAAILGGLLLLQLIFILSVSADKQSTNSQRNMKGLAVAILLIFAGIYLGLLLIDVIITGIVAGILWLWLAPLIALVLGILLVVFFAAKN